MQLHLFHVVRLHQRHTVHSKVDSIRKSVNIVQLCRIVHTNRRHTTKRQG